MHRLEYLLLILSERIRRETGNDDLADFREGSRKRIPRLSATFSGRG